MAPCDAREVSRRDTPLVLIGVVSDELPRALISTLRSEGFVVTLARGDSACLRVATAVMPDVILLDPRLPRPLLSLLRAHPLSRRAQISWSESLAAEAQTPGQSHALPRIPWRE